MVVWRTAKEGGKWVKAKVCGRDRGGENGMGKEGVCGKGGKCVRVN